MDTKSASIIGAVIVVVIGIGLTFWYISEHPAPYVNRPGLTGTGASTFVETPQNLDEAGRYYDVKAHFPSVTPFKSSAGALADAKAVEVMKQFEINTISAFKEQGNFDHLTAKDIQMLGLDTRKESLEIKYTVKTSAHTVSYLFTIYQDTLGAHPNTYFRSFTWNIKTGTGMTLDDFFLPETNYYKVLSELARKMLPEIISKSSEIGVSQVDKDYITRGTTPDADNFQNWYIDGSNLIIVFPPYQVAPYAAGEQKLLIPFSSLTGLRSTYR